MLRRGRGRRERGSAVVDFVLVLVVLVPVVLGVVQVALVMLVRNTLAAAASDPDARVSRLPLLSAAERARLAAEAAGPAVPLLSASPAARKLRPD